MFARCPACQTLFRVYADTLRVAQGQVRCGRCGAQFNALDSLTDAPEASPEEVEGSETGQAASLSSVAIENAVEAPPVMTVTAAEPIAVDAASVESTPEPEQESAPEVTPSPLTLTSEVIQEALLREEPAPRPFIPRLAGALAILALLALLGVQWAYLQRVALYDRPSLRPLLHRFCTVLNCELPLLRMPERIEVVERVVREHPRVPRALLVNLTFVSRANEPIAYPVVDMRLSDVSGNRAAGRRFLPTEYLPPGEDIAKGMLPGRPVQVALELVEPHIDAVSFQFEFH